MKFTCSQLTLTRALNTVSKAVSNKTTIPVLRGILIQAKDNRRTLTASDLDISIIREMPAEIEEEGSAVVPSKLFGVSIKDVGDIPKAINPAGRRASVQDLVNLKWLKRIEKL